MKASFGSRELIKCLTFLGFKPQKQHGTSHVKFSISGKHATKGARPFIIVILGRKSYDRHTISSYVRQIKSFGFTKEEILVGLKK